MRRSASEEGTSIIELLLILLPLFLLLFAAVDVGSIAGAREGLLRAAHAAMEEMQHSGQYDYTAQQAMDGTLAGAGIDPASVSVSTSAPASPGGAVWVTLSTTYQPPLPIPGEPGGYPIQAGAVGMVFP